LKDYQSFIHKSRYARYREDLGRRESWEETVQRYMDYVVGDKVPYELKKQIHNAIVNLDVMPSMRGLMTAGEALERDNVAIFNCGYVPCDSPRAFDEIMYILMCGTGEGFTVERQDIAKLPVVADEMHDTDTTIVVGDSKIGWAKAFKELLSMLYAGQVPKWDTSKVRSSGARLKVFGGRASGPEPLISLFKFCVKIFKGATGRKLTSLECHDIMCKIGETVVVGGVRRSALISLSSPDDVLLASAKSTFNIDEYVFLDETEDTWTYSITMKKGQPCQPTYKVTLSKHTQQYDQTQLELHKKIGWWIVEPQRSLANNSISYLKKPVVSDFLSSWLTMYESHTGERGIFNRVAAKKQAAKNGRREFNHEFGTNPCSEIILRPYQFCNLSECVARVDDTEESLMRKVEIATILGTIQATFTNFRYLRPIWKRNTEEEALLGVSFTGMTDCPLLQGNGYDDALLLNKLKEHSVAVNKEWAEKLGINQSTAITCVKPSGTVSQLVDAASGLHPRFSPYYIRRVRNSMNDPLTQFMAAQGIPWEVDKTNPSTAIFSFPMASPEGAVCKDDLTAIQQMKYWKHIQDEWCEHKPSITVYYNADEYMELGAWVWKHFDEISGVAFLPRSDHTYEQAPYEEINKEQYEHLLSQMPSIDWNEFLEAADNTEGSQTLACVGLGCEIP
jgi:ribonucleoside-triphosphate reductase (thioredoxin)